VGLYSFQSILIQLLVIDLKVLFNSSEILQSIIQVGSDGFGDVFELLDVLSHLPTEVTDLKGPFGVNTAHLTNQ
jgi:hypothetical protein